MRQAADELRAELAGDTVTFVVNRNINVSNVCTVGCAFCGFGVGQAARPDAYEHDRDGLRPPRPRRGRLRRDRDLHAVRASTPTGASRTTSAGCGSPRRPRRSSTCTRTARWRSRTCATSPGCAPRGRARAAARGRPGLGPRHRRRGARRRRPAADQPEQAAGRALGRDHRGRPPGRAALHRDRDVRPHRDAGRAGRAHARGARAAGAHRRLHRVRAAVVHPVPDAARPHSTGSSRSAARRTSSTPRCSGSRSAARSPTCRRAG